jgi:hypothetical protein
VVAGAAAGLRARHVASVRRAGRWDRPAEASGLHRMCCLNAIIMENWGIVVLLQTPAEVNNYGREVGSGEPWRHRLRRQRSVP